MSSRRRLRESAARARTRVERGSVATLLNRTLPSPGGRPILLTGHGRSGTTWIGKILAVPPNILYYREPSHTSRWPDGSFEHWFDYAAPGERFPYFEPILDRAFAGGICPGMRWDHARPLRLLRRRAMRVLVKEVASFMATDWMADRYDPVTLIVIRHPCAIVRSELSREVDAAASKHAMLANQRLRTVVPEHLFDLLRQATEPYAIFAVVWALRNWVVYRASARHPEWALLRYEALAADPRGGFREIARTLELPVSDAMIEAVEHSVSRSEAGSRSTRRRPWDAATRWRDEMSDAEMARVRRLIEPFELPYYQETKDFELSGDSVSDLWNTPAPS